MRRRGVLSGWVVGTVMVAALWAAVPLIPSFLADVPSASAAPAACGADPALARFDVAPGEGAAQIDAVDISGLTAGCDGAAAVLELRGNRAGDPSSPAAVLSTANSKLDPCTERAAHPPVTVRHGRIVFELCATGGPAGRVSVQELTSLSLLVNGSPVPVRPTSLPPGAGTGTGGTTGTGGPNGTGSPTGGPGGSTGSRGTGGDHPVSGTQGVVPGGATTSLSLAAGGSSTGPTKGKRTSEESSGALRHHRHRRPGEPGRFDWQLLVALLLLVLLLGLLALWLLLWRRRDEDDDGETVAA